MPHLLRAPLLVASLLALAGCKDPAPQVAAAALTPVASANPQAGHAGGLVGTVAERIDAANYTYLRLQTPDGESWAAVPATQVPVGTRVTIENPMPMRGFQSKSLNRTFDQIAFGSAAVVLAEGSAAPLPAGHGSFAPKEAAAVDFSTLKVARASGPDARTVAEIFAQRAALKDKQVSVRGKVVKVSNGILERNWLHLRDGSGSDAAKDNDLVVTTTATVQVNDEVTVQGVVHTDKDIGSGYVYRVLVEDGSISR